MIAIIQAGITLIILGILYRKMIKWEEPLTISKPQAITPILLGLVSLPISFGFTVGNGLVFQHLLGYSSETASPAVRTLMVAIFSAGLPEEFAKLLMILLVIYIFRKKIRNVYEYLLIGAGVGFGFSLLEEFAYGSNLISIVFRMLFVTGHMMFGMCMARHLGLARYNKTTGRGSVAKEYILAFLIPLAIHSLYDALVMNKFIESSDDTMQMIGICVGVTAEIIMIVLQFIVFIRLRKNTGKLIALSFFPEETETIGTAGTGETAEQGK